MSTLISLIGATAFIGGILMFFVMNITLGISAIISGVFLMVFGSMAQSLSNIESQLTQIAIMNKQMRIMMQDELNYVFKEEPQKPTQLARKQRF